MLNEVPILIVEAHSACNCRCEMCDIWRSPERRSFTPEQLARQLDSIDGLKVREVVFTGGEPLMNPELFDLCGPLRTRGIRLTLLSTGLLLERFAKQVKETFDEVIVSLDGPRPIHDRIRHTPGAFDALRRGVAAIQGAAVVARCVVQRENHDQLVATAAVAEEWGLGSISFLATDLTSTAFGREKELPILRRNRLAVEVEQLPVIEEQIQQLRTRSIVRDSAAHLQRIVDLFRAHLGLTEPRAPRCNAPFVSAYIHIDGTVQPCFFQPVVGSVQDRSLEEVLNADAAAQLRDNLRMDSNAICQRCVCSLYRS